MEAQQIVLGIIAAVPIVIAAAISAPRVLRDERWGISRDIEIYKALPPESSARTGLLEKIDRGVNALDKKRRNPSGIVLGIIFVISATAGAWFIYSASGLWWLASPLVIASLIVGLVGFGISIRKTIRDERGNTVPAKK